MKIEIEKIYRNGNYEVCMRIRCLESYPPSFDLYCEKTPEEARRRNDAYDKYERKRKAEMQELRAFFLGEAEIKQEGGANE